MLERNNPSIPRRQEDDLLRRSRFGGGIRRGFGVNEPPASPVLETVDSANETLDDRNGIAKKRLAMAYIPKQKWQNLLSPESALTNGTVFRELVFPFEGRTIRRR